MIGTETAANKLALARLALRGFRDRRHDEIEKYIVESCRKAGTLYNDSSGHFNAVFQDTRVGKSLFKKLRRLEATVRRLEDIEVTKTNKTNAKIKAQEDKKLAAEELAKFNASIAHLRCFTWTIRRHSCWGNVRTIYSVGAHGIELVRGKFRPTRRRLSATTTHHNSLEARAFHESKGDLFFDNPAQQFSDGQIVTQLTRRETDNSLTVHDIEYWKREHDKAHKSIRKYSKFCEILQDIQHPQNRYARWLKSYKACNSGIADAISGFDSSPYDTIKNGNEFQKGWLSNKNSDGIFTSWESFV